MQWLDNYREIVESVLFYSVFKVNLPHANLKRYPLQKKETLQAWDSADELILQYLNTIDLAQKRILILNDQFGALSCGLAGLDCTTYTDSYVSHQGIKQNSDGKIISISDLGALSGIYDYALIKIPNQSSFFEDQLCHLSQHLGSHSRLIGGAMVKHLSKSSFDLLQKYIGETTTSLAQKKARLIFADFQKKPVESPYPRRITIEGFEKPFIHHSNLFSREKLDIGTRFFLEHIPRGNFKTILDLGCANGIVGIRAKMLNPSASLIFSDESYMAVQSAKMNDENFCFSEEASPSVKSQFCWTHCYEQGDPNSVDLVLCNPPFHQQTTVGDFIARQMFVDAQRTLVVGGLLRVIGNSHLRYDVQLKRIFGNSRIVATNKKFMIVDAVKS